MSAPLITEETKYVTGVQAIKSGRWPFGNDTFYRMVREGLITRIRPYPGARPVFSVAEIDALYAPANAN